MSALGQKRTCAVQQGMSALPPKADMCSALVRNGLHELNKTTRRSRFLAC